MMNRVNATFWTSVSTLVLVGVLLAVFITSPAAIQQTSENKNTTLNATKGNVKTILSITGVGSIKYFPDTFIISFTAIGQGNTAEEALRLCSMKLGRTVEALKNNGVSEKDMETTTINLYPLYDWESKPPKIIGYEASYGLNVKTNSIELAGKLIDVAVNVGIDRVGGIFFTTSKEVLESLRNEAIKLALRDAEIKATLIAESLNLKISGIQSIQVSVSEPPIRIQPAYKETYTLSIPIYLPEEEYTATVSVTYEMEPKT
ncbi:MAG: SIMPL domain-containing protein [Nitrososphaerota archaeon]